MAFYTYRCSAGHETQRYAAVADCMKPVRCGQCNRMARRDAMDVPGAAARSRGQVRNIVSHAAGCMPHEVERATREAAEIGCDVQFRRDGAAVFATRADKLKYIKAFRMHDRDEVRG